MGLLIFCFLGFLSTVCVFGQMEAGCVNLQNLYEFNVLASAIVSQLQPGQEATIVPKLCNQQMMASSGKLSEMVKSCPQLLAVQTNLSPFPFLRRLVSEAFSMFDSEQQFCSCSSYLYEAYLLSTENLVIRMPGAAVEIVADLARYCSNQTASQSQMTVGEQILYVNTHLTLCPPLIQMANTDSKHIVRGIVDFIEDICPTFKIEEFNCILTITKTEAFKACFDEAAINTSYDPYVSGCMRRLCLEDFVLGCGESTIINYIFAVSMVIGTKPIIDYIPTQVCDIHINAAPTISMTFYLAVFIKLLCAWLV